MILLLSVWKSLRNNVHSSVHGVIKDLNEGGNRKTDTTHIICTQYDMRTIWHIVMQLTWEHSSIFYPWVLNTTSYNRKLFPMSLLCETRSFSGWKASLSHEQGCLSSFFLNERAKTSLGRVLESICLKSLWREWNTRQNQCRSHKRSLFPSLCCYLSSDPSPSPPSWHLFNSEEYSPQGHD